MSTPADIEGQPNRMAELANKRWHKQRENDAARIAASGGEPHPLFPTEEGEPIPDIRWIDIVRFQPGTGPVQHPRSFAAAELQSLEDLAGMFGGGVYELRGRAAVPSVGTPGPILRRLRYTLEGESIPFSGDQAPSMQQVPEAAGRPAADPTMILMIQMMDANAKEARASADRQMQMMLAMMTNQSSQQVESMRSMVTLIAPVLAGGNRGPDVGALMSGMAAMSSAQFQQVAALLPKETTDPMDRLTKLLDLAKGLKDAPKEESLGEMLGGLGQAFAGFAAIEEMRKNGAAAAQAGAAPAAASSAQPQQQQASEPPPPPVRQEVRGLES